MSTATATSTYAAKATRFSGGLRAFVNEWMILFLFLALFAICAITIDRFLELGNLMNIARQISFLAIVALGQFFVILTAELDLSIGSSIGLQSVLLAGFVANSGFSVWAALALVLVTAVVIGVVNGLLVIHGNVPSFIATLVTMNVLTGIAFLYSRGLPISGLPSWLNYLGMGYFYSIPVPVYLMIIVTVFCYVFTMHTELGRSFFAVGGNKEAARLSGINVKFIGVLAFVLCSLLATIGSIGLTARTMSGSATLGDAMLFDVMTVVVLGGTSLFGGKGNVLGVVLAAFLTGVISNAMVLMSIDTYFQWIVKGAILITVVLIDVNSKRK
ncbi:ABC transporter permease [Tessaracoccus rhinocerotis]|uniref:ABC transporter permease n=1 Tax=Tessaracoccus rhinocerotis TaxID=1689449 RepID=A0A553K0X9_9ACTN|nr:ABC transporter permease [Tessaracoccus rhinocerotis]TRY18339.1 ABC transporter permease [Tessaracoccus rhinocerotis]